MGFKLRSGNGPLAFKNMGSSPALQRDEKMIKIEPIQTKKVGEDLKVPDKLEGTKSFEEISAEIKAEKTEANKGKHKDQIKKQEKLDKITARRERKGKEGLTNRQMKLKEQTNKTGEEYMADKTAKKDADRKKASEIMIGISKNFDSKSQFKSLADQEAQSSTTKRRNQNIEDYELGKNKQMELDDELSNKTNEDGTAKIEKTQVEIVDEEKVAKEESE